MTLPDFRDRRPDMTTERLATHRGRQFQISPDEIAGPGTRGVMLDDGTTVTPECADHIQHLIDHPLNEAATRHVEIAPGVHELTDPHKVYAIPSASTDRIHQVTVNTRTGAMRCDGPRCNGRTCSHQKRVLATRAGF